MIRIALTAEAFDAVSARLPFGSVGFEREPSASRRRGAVVRSFRERGSDIDCRPSLGYMTPEKAPKQPWLPHWSL
jgi:hypothetical protein